MNKPKRSKYAPRVTTSGFKEPKFKNAGAERLYKQPKPFESVTLKAIEDKMKEIEEARYEKLKNQSRSAVDAAQKCGCGCA